MSAGLRLAAAFEGSATNTACQLQLRKTYRHGHCRLSMNALVIETSNCCPTRRSFGRLSLETLPFDRCIRLGIVGGLLFSELGTCRSQTRMELEDIVFAVCTRFRVLQIRVVFGRRVLCRLFHEELFEERL